MSFHSPDGKLTRTGRKTYSFDSSDKLIRQRNQKPEQIQVGSLAGAAHLLNDNAGVQ